MAAPVELVTKDKREREQAQKSIVDTAEELLAEAKAGNVGAIVLVVKDAEGHWHHRMTHNFNLREEIGSLFLLSLERGAQVLGESEDE